MCEAEREKSRFSQSFHAKAALSIISPTESEVNQAHSDGMPNTIVEVSQISTLAVIPARLASTRLPRKVLREIAGQPMLAWVYEAARACRALDQILIATDSEEVMRLCEANAWPAVLTSPDLPSGSDRVHAVAQLHPAGIYVNIQGDEPLLHPAHIAALLEPFADAAVQVATLKTLCTPENFANPNAVKVVATPHGRALYFSRSTIPYDRENSGAPVFKHLGFYAYRAEALNRFHSLAPSPLELTERLEQLRFLEHGIPIHVAETPHDTIGVDTEEDLRRVERILLSRLP
jgi:3-deoxy-manno-octulosonate cytidylyltransferase (CMP-KDO synthetase)